MNVRLIARLRRLAGLAVVACLCVHTPLPAAPENDPHYQPVKAVGDRLLTVTTAQGTGVARYFGTGSLDEPSTTTIRAMIDFHGALRNADVYEKTGEAAIAAAGPLAAGTLLVTPQFLTKIDIEGNHLPADTLAWDVDTWIDGKPAQSPAPLSTFDVLDTIVQRLADRQRFPHLREIVIFGHSAGGQFAQRYAAIGHALDAPLAAKIPIRFVIANPSSYLYFSADRPRAGGTFAPFPAAACPEFNQWKYGLEQLPPYASGAPGEFEGRYVSRRLTYLLGQLDIDPNQAVIDKSCMAEAQGPYRLIRGQNYAAYIKQRHPGGTNQDEVEVAGVEHDARGMFTSACGVAILFDLPRKACAVDAKV